LLFDGLREDLDKPEFHHVREFAIVASSQVTFVSDVLRFVYYEEQLPNIRTVVDALVADGYVDSVAPTKKPIYRMREKFISALETL
jgi:hypothetical protein